MEYCNSTVSLRFYQIGFTVEFISIICCLCLQGLDATNAKLDLISNVIRQTLNINCAVLMGANIAGEVALEHYCETTIGQHLSLSFCFTLDVMENVCTQTCIDYCLSQAVTVFYVHSW